MVSFNYECDFLLEDESYISRWITTVIESETKKEGDINYIFCDDDYLLKLNREFLEHNTLTDIISFDYSMGNVVNGDIFISIERVKENAVDFNVGYKEELKRVMVHGILHYCGYNDKSDKEKKVMRKKEDFYLKLAD